MSQSAWSVLMGAPWGCTSLVGGSPLAPRGAQSLSAGPLGSLCSEPVCRASGLMVLTARLQGLWTHGAQSACAGLWTEGTRHPQQAPLCQGTSILGRPGAGVRRILRDFSDPDPGAFAGQSLCLAARSAPSSPWTQFPNISEAVI